MKNPALKRYLVVPRALPARPRNHAQIDPLMIIHPQQSRLGVQPPGTPILQNDYPGLELLPIELSSVRLEEMPITWPNLKLQTIPIVCPKAKLIPIDTKETAEPKHP